MIEMLGVTMGIVATAMAAYAMAEVRSSKKQVENLEILIKKCEELREDTIRG
ncbi:MAG: hypothetical protein ACRCX2_23440 [Paraclostridium sp.]